MKKFLSLAMALIMTMSLVTISASADFTDDSAITYSEAVDVMYALGVISGYTDGSFDPTATLTRGAAAKIICNMMLGPTTADALSADAAPFPDVAASHTFAAYIAYCADQGILSGYADGNFYPANEVTGYQFMKMLLGALGYDSEVEGFTGDNWSISVAKLAVSIGLEDGNDDYVGTAALTREEACLYALNTLQATMVEYDTQSNISIGDITITSSSKAEEVTISSDKATIDEDGYVQFAEKYFTKLSVAYDATDAFGRPANTWTYSNSEIGTYVDYTDLIASYTDKVTKGTMYSLIGKTDVGNMVMDSDHNDDADVDTLVYVDGVKTTGWSVTDVAISSSSSSIGDSTITGNSVATEVFEDDNGDLTIIIINTYVVQATSDYSTSKETLSIDDLNGVDIASTIDNDDVYVEDFVEDDYILVTVDMGDGSVQSAVLAETVTGEVTSYTTSTNVYLDGTKYLYAYVASSDDKATTYSIGEDACLVLDTLGNVLYVDDAVVNAGNYVYITEYASSGSLSTSAVTAAAYFSDGTYEEIEVSKFLGDSISKSWLDTSSDIVVLKDTLTDGISDGTGWYTYSANSSSEYSLTAVESKYTPAATLTFKEKADSAVTVITNSAVTFAYDGTNSLKGNSSTVFVIADADGDVYTYTGITNVADVAISADSNTGESVTVDALLNTSGYAAFVFVNMTDIDSSSVDSTEASSTDYLMILPGTNKSGKDSNGDTYYLYEAYADGEIIDVYTDSYAMYDPGTVYNNIKTNSSGYITSADDVGDGNDGAETAVSDVSSYAITYSSDVLSIYDDSGNLIDSFIIDDTDIVFVSAAGELNVDENADYEVTDTMSTAKAIYNEMDGYTFSGSYYAVADDTGSENLDNLFIYVSSVGYYTLGINSLKTSLAGEAVNGFDGATSSAGSNYQVGDSVTVTITSTSGATADKTMVLSATVNGLDVELGSVEVAAGDSSADITFSMPDARLNSMMSLS